MVKGSSNFTNINIETPQVGDGVNKKWNTMSKCLMVLLVVILAVAIALAVALIVVEDKDDTTVPKKTPGTISHKPTAAMPHHQPNHGTDDVKTTPEDTEPFCVTQQCILGASQVIEGMNPTVDPCDDFYNYACGGWLETHTIPEDASRFGTFTKLRRELQVQLRGLLEEPMDEDDIEAVNKTKRLYRSCMDEEKIVKAGTAPLIKTLKELGGWPVLDKTWKETNFNLVELLIKLRLYNNELLMSWGVSTDSKVPDKHIIYFDQEALGMPSRDYYMKGRNDDTLLTYEKIAVNAAKMLGADETTARKDISDVMDFEIEIANITATKEERREAGEEYNKMTIEHLQNNVLPDFPFKMMDLVLPYFEHANITINDTTEILIYQINFFKKLSDLLKATDNRTICNYLISRFVRHRIYNLPAKFRHLGDEFSKKVSGVLASPARWKSCVSYVNSDTLMGDVTGRMFIQRYFDDSAKVEAKTLIANLRAAFKKKISKATWMDSETQSYAQEKLAAIEEKIGFDKDLLNDTLVDESNEVWDFKEDDYFGNQLRVLRQYAMGNMHLLEKDVDRSLWTTTPGVVNAFYSPSRNRITFPAGILQPPFYGKNYPSAMNYGGIGAVIGHEMTHGFDDQGRAYDKDGRLKQWWTNSSLLEFKTKAKCMQEQYSAFIENGDHVRGKVTLGENIADTGGMGIAFQAYEEYVAVHGEEKPLPGVDLTNRQLVFISFAQAFCSKSTPQYMHFLITTNEHSPEKFRIAGTLSNNEEFSKQFQCKKGSRMNPVKKCSVW